MNTTNLFVELVVIGTGVFLWSLLLAGSALGFTWLPLADAVMVAAALPTLAVIYVMGIVWDRVSDALFERLWTDDLRASFFLDRTAYYIARRVILTRSEPLSELLEYGRSRLRICRGWSLNALMIAVCLNLYLFRHNDPAAISTTAITGTLACLALSGGCWFAWYSLARTEYRKIRDQADYLKQTHEKE